MNCVQWFRKAYPTVLAFHVPNGEYRHQHTADTLQRMGVLPGVADWLMFDQQRSMLAIELKAKDGVESEEQYAFKAQWIECGGSYAVARTLKDFQDVCLSFYGPGNEPAVEYDTTVLPEIVIPPPLKMPWET